MKNLRQRSRCMFLVFMFLVVSGVVQAQTARIVGRVVDGVSGEALPGAAVFIKGTGFGAVSDIGGHFTLQLSGLAPGNYTLVARYIGYRGREFQIVFPQDEDIREDIKLTAESIEGEEVVVTAQAEAQMQAMNQQLSSKTIQSIVSKKQIQELPEANAAEAVGRLPGVSLERSGGEGNKVVIRGMASKYSMIQIDGVNLTATGEEDRSTDLSMISPYMLEGIELTKSVMANQEATATGGIVNFRIRKAPDDPAVDVIAQGGMNTLRKTYSDFKFSIGGSNRFFDKQLGVYGQFDYEKRDNGSQEFGGVNISQENTSAPVRTNIMELDDILRNIQRMGATLVLDYSLSSTTFKSSNLFSRSKREETQYNDNYDFHRNTFSMGFDDTPEAWLTVLTNSLQIEHKANGWELAATLSHAYSENKNPLSISSTNGGTVPNQPFGVNRQSNFDVDVDPETIPNLFLYNWDQTIENMTLSGINISRTDTRERDLAADLSVAYTLNITDQINAKLTLGGKFKYKTKEYDKTANGFANEGLMKVAHDNFPISARSDEYYRRDPRNLYLSDFLTPNGGSFLGGKYAFSPIFDRNKFRKLYDLANAIQDDQLYSIWSLYQPDFPASVYSDYSGFENYQALYLMPEINLGPQLLFIPGVRYEANRTEYTGYRGNRLGVLRSFTPTPVDTVTKVRREEFLLPMIHVFFKPTEWLTVKAGYTHTIMRPNYNNIMPGWMIGTQGSIDNLANFNLRSEQSRNWDIQLSFHTDQIGLLSVGAFHKRITDMIFWSGQKAILDTAFFELPTIMSRKLAAYAENNPNPASNYGFEIEWQSNFWYLPGLLKGIVVNINYTRDWSNADYPRTVVKSVIDPKTYKATYVNNDTSYSSPLIQQPDHLLNLVLGYDFKGFSFRWALMYKSHIFKSANWYEALRVYSAAFYRSDVQVRQKLPIEGMEIYLNANNLTGEKEHDLLNHLSFSNYIEDYGRSANIGLRYQL
jgi:TonB-dependent receptor